MVECILDKNLLVLGLGADQIPGLLKAKEMGYKLIGLDANTNAKGVEYVDEFYPISIKKWDQVEGFLLNKLTQKVSGVIAFGVDIPTIVARAADYLGVNFTIPLEAALVSEDKYSSKLLMQSLDVPVPFFSEVTNITELEFFAKKHGFPLVVKPVDNSAARGIHFVQNTSELKQAFRYAFDNSQKGVIIVEKYLTGSQISSESLIVNGEVVHIGFADRNYQEFKRFFPFIIEDGGDMPSSYMSDSYKASLKLYWHKIANKLQIKNGIFKGDLVIHDEKLYVIEFALRMSGGHFSSIEIPASTGVDYLKATIQLHNNQAINLSNLNARKNQYLSLRYRFIEDLSLSKSRTIESIRVPKATQTDILSSQIYVEIGQKLSEQTVSHAHRLACAIALGNSREEAISHASDWLNSMEFACD